MTPDDFHRELAARCEAERERISRMLPAELEVEMKRLAQKIVNDAPHVRRILEDAQARLKDALDAHDKDEWRLRWRKERRKATFAFWFNLLMVVVMGALALWTDATASTPWQFINFAFMLVNSHAGFLSLRTFHSINGRLAELDEEIAQQGFPE